MRKLIALFLPAMLLFSGCTEDYKRKAERAAAHAGIQNPVAAWDFWKLNCSESDNLQFNITGRDQSGQPVNAVACMGFWFKGATVRYMD